MTDLWKLGAAQSAQMIRDKEVKPSELMASVVDRIGAVNGHLNAITYDLTDQAIAEASAADDAVVSGAELGPLHGVPATIKENVDMAGVPNPNGVPAFAELMATEDAPLVRNLRNAGAIIVGRTNVPEFSMRGTTDNPLRGRTYNPWEDRASPGGSSGGAGSACASGMGAIHHGNDIGGSLRFPSNACGVMTVKPTTCRIPVFNSSAPGERGPLSSAMSVQGIIARHAADVRLATSVMITPDPRDPNCPPVPWTGPDLGGLPKVAVTKAAHGYPIHDGIVSLIDRVADQLRDAGYEVVDADPPPVSAPAAEWFRAGTTEMESTMDSAIREYGSETINKIFTNYYEMSELLDRDGYIKAYADRTGLMRDWNLFLHEYPLLLSPFMMSPLYDWDVDTRGLDAVKDFFESSMYSTGINYLGLPAGVMGIDMVEERPCAIQLIGQRYREDLICDALESIEGRNGVLTDRLWARES